MNPHAHRQNSQYIGAAGARDGDDLDEVDREGELGNWTDEAGLRANAIEVAKGGKRKGGVGSQPAGAKKQSEAGAKKPAGSQSLITTASWTSRVMGGTEEGQGARTRRRNLCKRFNAQDTNFMCQ
jgi:hypothetical protein